MSQRHLLIECVICRSPFPIKYATALPRVDAYGTLTHEIAAYVWDSRLCFLRARCESLPSPRFSHTTKEVS